MLFILVLFTHPYVANIISNPIEFLFELPNLITGKILKCISPIPLKALPMGPPQPHLPLLDLFASWRNWAGGCTEKLLIRSLWKAIKKSSLEKSHNENFNFVDTWPDVYGWSRNVSCNICVMCELYLLTAGSRVILVSILFIWKIVN